MSFYFKVPCQKICLFVVSYCEGLLYRESIFASIFEMCIDRFYCERGDKCSLYHSQQSVSYIVVVDDRLLLYGKKPCCTGCICSGRFVHTFHKHPHIVVLMWAVGAL